MTPATTAHAPIPQRGDMRRSVHVPEGGKFLRRLFVFLGPGYLVATGYMDPGNWATALAGGSQFGTALLFVAVLSSLMAIVLQSLAARLGVGAELDLAQACRKHYPFPAAVGLWLLAEVGIFATDLAEVIGTAIGLQLLFGLPLAIGILITVLDTFLVLALERVGFRKIELFVVAMLALITMSFTAQLIMARPDMAQVAAGLIPTRRFFTDPEMLYIGLGILGAYAGPRYYGPYYGPTYYRSGYRDGCYVGPQRCEVVGQTCWRNSYGDRVCRDKVSCYSPRYCD